MAAIFTKKTQYSLLNISAVKSINCTESVSEKEVDSTDSGSYRIFPLAPDETNCVGPVGQLAVMLVDTPAGHKTCGILDLRAEALVLSAMTDITGRMQLRAAVVICGE